MDKVSLRENVAIIQTFRKTKQGSQSLFALAKASPLQALLVVCINVLATLIVTLSLSFVAYSPESREWCYWNSKSNNSYVCSGANPGGEDDPPITWDNVLRLLLSALICALYFVLAATVLLSFPARVWMLNFNYRFNDFAKLKKITAVPPDYSYFESLMRQSEVSSRLGLNRNQIIDCKMKKIIRQKNQFNSHGQ